MIITEFAVTPRRADWVTVLQRTRQATDNL